jgi:hypothetical protein
VQSPELKPQYYQIKRRRRRRRSSREEEEESEVLSVICYSVS